MQSSVGKNALNCCVIYGAYNIQMVNSTTVQNWYNVTTFDELLSKVSALSELICIWDGSFHVAGNGAPLFSLQEVNSFISSICTYDVLFLILYCTFLVRNI